MEQPVSEQEGGPVSESGDWEQTLKETLPQDNVTESASDAVPTASPETRPHQASESAASRPTTPTRLRWVEPSIPPHQMATRRTGVAFLSLILTTNCIPWTQFAQSNSDGPRFVSFQETLLIVMMCFFAAALVITAWFLGRRLPTDRGPRVANPRDAGLMLAVLAAGSNLALAIIIRSAQLSDPKSLRLLGAVWLLLILPMQAAAGYCKGRASIPFRRPAGIPVKPTAAISLPRPTAAAAPLHK